MRYWTGHRLGNGPRHRPLARARVPVAVEEVAAEPARDWESLAGYGDWD
ncbi:MAG: hypothetical protein KME26_24765 [Oscillatoria princeps RMCB-10]|nr:hypothetical protein [Oscillatoria princeps RMCB-10]